MKTLTILLADDDSDDHEFFKEALDEIVKQPYQLVSAFNGLEALDWLLGNKKIDDAVVKPDFIVLDLNMPLMDGFATLEKIKAAKSIKNIPTYILTTSWMEAHVIKCRVLGADGYFTKPNNISALSATIKKMISDLR